MSQVGLCQVCIVGDIDLVRQYGDFFSFKFFKNFICMWECLFVMYLCYMYVFFGQVRVLDFLKLIISGCELFDVGFRI